MKNWQLVFCPRPIWDRMEISILLLAKWGGVSACLLLPRMGHLHRSVRNENFVQEWKLLIWEWIKTKTFSWIYTLSCRSQHCSMWFVGPVSHGQWCSPCLRSEHSSAEASLQKEGKGGVRSLKKGNKNSNTFFLSLPIITNLYSLFAVTFLTVCIGDAGVQSGSSWYNSFFSEQ